MYALPLPFGKCVGNVSLGFVPICLRLRWWPIGVSDRLMFSGHYPGLPSIWIFLGQYRCVRLRVGVERTNNFSYSCSNCKVYVVHVHDCAVPSPYILRCRRCAVRQQKWTLNSRLRPPCLLWDRHTWHSTVDLHAATPANVAKKV